MSKARGVVCGGKHGRKGVNERRLAKCSRTKQRAERVGMLREALVEKGASRRVRRVLRRRLWRVVGRRES